MTDGGDELHDRNGAAPTSATSTGRESTPWHAKQQAAWGTLNKGR